MKNLFDKSSFGWFTNNINSIINVIYTTLFVEIPTNTHSYIIWQAVTFSTTIYYFASETKPSNTHSQSSHPEIFFLVSSKREK